MPRVFKIKNTTSLYTDDLAQLLEGAITRVGTTLPISVEFAVNKRARKALHLTRDEEAKQIIIQIAKPLLTGDLVKLAGDLGAYLYWGIYRVAFGEKPKKVDWAWGKQVALRVKAEPVAVKKSAVQLREDKARRRLEWLQRELVGLDARRVKLVKDLKKAEARVKYYDKRLSKSAQEVDWQSRLQQKVSALSTIDGAFSVSETL